jgi:hypothetical protein
MDCKTRNWSGRLNSSSKKLSGVWTAKEANDEKKKP